MKKSKKPTVTKQRNVPVNLSEVLSRSSSYLFFNSFPSLFRIARFNLKDLEELAEDQNLGRNFLEAHIEYAIFRNKLVKATKRNLRKYLKDQGELREKRLFFYLGQPHTSIVYRNPIVQSFFEFSLFYSWIKNVEISAKKATTLFIKACQMSVGLSTRNKDEMQVFDDFLNVIQGNAAYFNLEDLPARKQDEKTKLILELNRQGKKPREIVERLAKEEIERKTNKYISEGSTPFKAKEKAEKDIDKGWILKERINTRSIISFHKKQRDS